MMLTSAPQPTFAQDIMKTVEGRQKAMRSFGGNMKAIGGFIKAGKGSAADVEKRLMAMAATAPKIPNFFPKGSDSETLGLKKSGARPEIWTKWDDFKKASDNMAVQARKFAAVIKTGDKAAMGKAMGAFGKSACGTCHRPFRKKRPK